MATTNTKWALESIGCRGDWSSNNDCCGICAVHRNQHAARLSKAQMAFLVNAAEYDPVKYDPYPFGGGRMSKIWASAWHRTAHALQRRGMVAVERVGDHYAAQLTDTGRQWCFVNGAS